MNTRAAILKFRHGYGARYGSENPSTPSDVSQILGLQEARLLAVALLLEVQPEALLRILNHMVWDSDLSELALATARSNLGFGDTVWLTSEDIKAFLETIKAPPPLAPALRRAFDRRVFLFLLGLGEKELEAGAVRPAGEVLREFRRRGQATSMVEEAEVMKEIDAEVTEARRHRRKRTPEEQAELKAAIKKVVEGFPPRSTEDFDAVRIALEAKWKK